MFRAYPTDNVETFDEYQKWTSQMSLAEYQPSQAEERLRDLRGLFIFAIKSHDSRIINTAHHFPWLAHLHKNILSCLHSHIDSFSGTLVEFPLNFLCKAVLTPGITSKEGLVPSAVFT